MEDVSYYGTTPGAQQIGALTTHLNTSQKDLKLTLALEDSLHISSTKSADSYTVRGSSPHLRTLVKSSISNPGVLHYSPKDLLDQSSKATTLHHRSPKALQNTRKSVRIIFILNILQGSN